METVTTAQIAFFEVGSSPAEMGLLTLVTFISYHFQFEVLPSAPLYRWVVGHVHHFCFWAHSVDPQAYETIFQDLPEMNVHEMKVTG